MRCVTCRICSGHLFPTTEGSGAMVGRFVRGYVWVEGEQPKGCNLLQAA